MLKCLAIIVGISGSILHYSELTLENVYAIVQIYVAANGQMWNKPSGHTDPCYGVLIAKMISKPPPPPGTN